MERKRIASGIAMAKKKRGIAMAKKKRCVGKLFPPWWLKNPRVGTPDDGLQSNECMKLYLVSSKEEVDSADSSGIPVGWSSWKIYGYQGLKVAIWVSTLSFHAYADISFDSKSDRGKGITDLRATLQDIFAKNLVEEKEDFLNTFTSDYDYVKSVVSEAQILKRNVSNESDGSNSTPADLEVLQVVRQPFIALCNRLEPLALLINGSKPPSIASACVILIQKDVNKLEDGQKKLLGFAVTYNLPYDIDVDRFCLRQVLILPPYQQNGYGRFLLEALNRYAMHKCTIYDMIVEHPTETFQHLRTCIDVQRLIVFKRIQNALKAMALCLKQGHPLNEKRRCKYGPPISAVDVARRKLKINMKQFSDCWEILLYLQLNPIEKYMESFRTIISGRIKGHIFASKFLVDFHTEYLEEMPRKSHGSEQTCIEMDEDDEDESEQEQLNRLVDERMRKIKLVAEEVSVHHH